MDEKAYRALPVENGVINVSGERISAPVGESVTLTYDAIGGVFKDTFAKVKLHRKNRGIGRTRKASSKRKKK